MMKMVVLIGFAVVLGIVWFLFSRQAKGYQRDEQAINDLISKGCTRYFDGCNTCTLENGNRQCTMI